LIKDILKIHDKFSIEIKQSYYSIFKKKKSNYRVLTYLFIPNGLNINEQTYKKEQFYKDIRVNVRYNTPEYTLDHLLTDNKSPLLKVEEIIASFDKKMSIVQQSKLETQGKIFATIFSSALRNSNRKIRKDFKTNKDPKLIDHHLSKIEEIVNRFRDIHKKIRKLEITDAQKRHMSFVDEFISNTIEHQAVILYDYFEKRIEGESDILNNLIAFIKKEQVYKQEKFYEGRDIESLNQEYIIHKRSQLKKYIDSIFFLQKDIRKDGTIYEQTIFSIAAGLAMIFSTGIAFFYQQKYGNFTTTFFIALVLSYMMKDRIKNLIGNLFISKAHSFYYDYKIRIFNSNKNKIGEIRENFSFVPYHKLGPKIKKFRKSYRSIDAEDNLFGEQIIQYKKKITLFPKRLGQDKSENRLNSIADITRINFSRFTSNMDDPKKKYYYVKDNKIIKTEQDRVYHINIVQKFFTENEIEFKRYRVVLNRDGIKRIEKVNWEN
jgi:hypothetical protein